MWSVSDVSFGLSETKEQPKSLEMIETGDRTFTICKKLYQYFLDQADHVNFSADYHDKLFDFLNICRAVNNNARDQYQPVMFYTTTNKLLSSLFPIKKQPGGAYHDTRAPLLALYHDHDERKTAELERGIKQFLTYLEKRNQNGTYESNEHIFITPSVQEVIFSNPSPSLKRQ